MMVRISAPVNWKVQEFACLEIGYVKSATASA